VGALCEDIHAFLCTDVAECGIPKLPWLQRESQTYFSMMISLCNVTGAKHPIMQWFSSSGNSYVTGAIHEGQSLTSVGHATIFMVCIYCLTC
jgi:hypothetical protein